MKTQFEQNEPDRMRNEEYCYQINLFYKNHPPESPSGVIFF